MGPEHIKLELAGELDMDQVVKLRSDVEGWLSEGGMAVPVKAAAVAVVEELVTNIMEHSSAAWLEISMAPFKDGVLLSVQDNGEIFDPKDLIANRDYAKSLEEGTDRSLGLFMVKELAKKFKYYREADINRVVMEIPLRQPSGA